MTLTTSPIFRSDCILHCLQTVWWKCKVKRMSKCILTWFILLATGSICPSLFSTVISVIRRSQWTSAVWMLGGSICPIGTDAGHLVLLPVPLLLPQLLLPQLLSTTTTAATTTTTRSGTDPGHSVLLTLLPLLLLLLLALMLVTQRTSGSFSYW